MTVYELRHARGEVLRTLVESDASSATYHDPRGANDPRHRPAGGPAGR